MKKLGQISVMIAGLILLFVFIGCSSSSTDNNTPVNNPPTAPSALTAIQTVRGTVVLNWTVGADADTMKVSRSADNMVTWGQIALLGGTIATYSDGTPGYNSQKWYKIKGANAYGESGYSNVASIWTLPLVYSFGSDQTANFTVTYSGSGTPFTWTYADQAGKLHITSPAANQYVAILTVDSLPNQGWAEANLRIGHWGATEVGMFVEKNPQNADNDVVGAFFYRDSTVVGYYASGVFTRKLEDTQHKIAENTATKVQFLHSGSNWKLILADTELGSWDIDNVATSGHLKMEWQINTGGQTDQDFWLKDVAQANPPVVFGQGNNVAAVSPVHVAPKTK